MRRFSALVLFFVGLSCTLAAPGDGYFGKPLGRLSELEHGVKGKVFAVDSRTLFLQDFYYDGEGPAAFFYVGTTGSPNAAGAIRLRDERGSTSSIRKYRGESITLTVPEPHTLKDIKWFSVWCDEFSVNFGDIRVPRNFDYPRPAKVGALSGIHHVSSDPIVVVDAQTLLIPNFSYDGEAPDAKFWVGRGNKPSPQGIKIPDENGVETPLRRYDKKTIVLTLPGELTVFDIGHFGVWCEAFTVDFGHVQLPYSKLSNIPPSLKMLGVSPQSKLNCEVLYEDLAFEVRWALAGESIVLQLVSRLEDGEYMSFGISGSDTKSQMVGGDVVVAWVDKTSLKGYAHDYYLDAKSQCAGVRGSCPDETLGEKTNSVRLLNAALVNGYSIVTYQRSLKAADELDRAIITNSSQPIIWAIGPLNSKNEVSYHSHFTKGDKLIDFGRPPVWNCPMPETEEDHEQEDQETDTQTQKITELQTAGYTQLQKRPVEVPRPASVPPTTPWEIPAIECSEPADGVFYAQMGPTGGKQGYSAITGHVGWGISWYINGLLIPEINVVRGKKYTFVVEGGNNPDQPAKYHPFYITNDPVGGYHHKSDEERKGVEIYAGIRRTRSGELIPTGVGRLCNWTPDADGPEADEYPSFGAYQRSLTLVCQPGNPGVVTWTPDQHTPDTVYYQCFTHRYLGWKINVLDECDESEAAGSSIIEELAEPDPLIAEESIQVPTQVKPEYNHILDERKKYQKVINTKPNHNVYGESENDQLTGEVNYRQNQYNKPEYELPISNGQIKDVIETVESLESLMKNEYYKNMSQQAEAQKNKEFAPEQPIPDDGEYIIEQGLPSSYMLPPNLKPLTLQSVLRPHPNRPGPQGRPPFRRPVPPQIKLQRPPYNNLKNYPLSMPGMMQQGHGPQNLGPQKPHGPSPQGQMGSQPQSPPGTHGAQPYGPPQPNSPPPHGNPQFNQQPNNPQMHGPHVNPSQPVFPKKPNNKPPPRMPMNKGRPPVKPMHGPNYGPNPVQVQGPIHGPNPVMIHVPNKQLVPGQVQSIIMGKPIQGLPSQSQTLNVGKSDLIANQVVKSQIILPSLGDSLGQQSVIQPFLSKPGQIILGRPMEHPVPLDQQMQPTKYQPVRIPGLVPSPDFPSTSKPQEDTEVKSSDFIGESTEESSLPPAVNTGFKPDTIVVESGFKPIIREPLMAAEDRITDYDGTNNRREDTDVPEDYIDSPQGLNNNVFDLKPPEIPSDKLTQSFEPMFIPSPEDHLFESGKDTSQKEYPVFQQPSSTTLKEIISTTELNQIDRKYIITDELTREIFPKNHAKEDRPHPVYVKTESELNALLSKKNVEQEESQDLVTEETRYQKPTTKSKTDSKLYYTAYDDTPVTADVTDTALYGADSSATVKNKTQSLFELMKQAQLEPYKGKLTKPTKKPEHIRFADFFGHLTDDDNDSSEEMETAGTEYAAAKENKNKTKKYEAENEDEEYDYEDEEVEKEESRRKRDVKDNIKQIDFVDQTPNRGAYFQFSLINIVLLVYTLHLF